MGRLIEEAVERVAIQCGNSDAGRSGGVLSECGQQVILGVSRQGCIYPVFKYTALVGLLGWWGLSRSSFGGRPMSPGLV